MGEIRDAVDATVAALNLDGTDAGLVAYARALADQIDERARVAHYAAAAIAAYDRDPDEYGEDFGEALGVLRAKLSERETLDRLGARLHAVLVELGASPRARAKGEAPKPLPKATGSKLSIMRGGA